MLNWHQVTKLVVIASVSIEACSWSSHANNATVLSIAPERAMQLNNEAVSYLAHGKFVGAIHKLMEALKVYPNYSLAKNNLVIAFNNYGILLAKHNPEQALRYFHKALYLDPFDNTARSNLISLLKSLGKNPEIFENRLAFAQQCRDKGDTVGAIVEYQESFRLEHSAKIKKILASIPAPNDLPEPFSTPPRERKLYDSDPYRPAHKESTTSLLPYTNLVWKTFSIYKPLTKKQPYTVTVKYPQFRGSDALVSRLNRQVYRYVMSIYKDGLKEMREMGFGDRTLESDSGALELSIDYEIAIANTRLVSIRFTDSRYTGGAHGESFNKTFNLDVKDGTLLKLSDVFDSHCDYLQCLSDACYPSLLRQLQPENLLYNGSLGRGDKDKLQPEDCLYNQLEMGLTPNEQHFEHFVLTRTGIRILFEEYQLAGYAQGMPEVTLSYKKLVPILRPGSIICRSFIKLPKQRENLDEFQEKLSKDKAIAIISVCSERITKDPKNGGLYFDRARAYGDLQRYEPAVSDYTISLEIEPNQAIAYYHRGIAYDGLRMWEKAVTDYSKAVEVDPALTDSYGERGTDYLRLKEYNKAIDDLSKAIAIDKKAHCLFCRRGLAHFMEKNYERAVADFTTALSLEPEDSYGYHHRAEALLSLGRIEKALTDINKAIKLSPKIGSFYANRALIYEKLGKSKEAEQDRTTSSGLMIHQDTHADCL